MSSTHRSIVLLLTATIDPGQTPLVVRSDPLLRLNDYEMSLKDWLVSGAVDKIVFYDNSGFDLGRLVTVASKFPSIEVEFHSFVDNNSASKKGKGYSELACILQVIERSKLLQDCGLIAKCTGRLSVRKAQRLFESCRDQDFDIMCTLKTYLTFADSRLFIATPAFFTCYLASQQEIIDDAKGIFLEHALARATSRALGDRLQWKPFPSYPQFVGISGTYGIRITNGIAKGLVKALYHRLRNAVYAH